MKRFPLNKERVCVTSDSNSFVNVDYKKETEIPIDSHVGAFGVQRKFHTHEGVDLYCNKGDAVYAIEDGEVIFIEEFTGEKAGSPWWNDTQAVQVIGESGIINNGEIVAVETLKVGQKIYQGDLIGHVTPVLKKDKGRPMCMLHVELYDPQYAGNKAFCWNVGVERHPLLKDPTELLKSCKIHHIV